jgi:topoisomerase-4 subunit A
VRREEARAFSELELMTADPITVVLSEKGWIRAAKGTMSTPHRLSYKSGDAFKLAARGRSNQSAVILDSTGRAYTLPTHNLPSARGQGEPLTGRINPPSGAAFDGLLLGDPQQRCLLASDAGYGFVTTLGDLQTKNRAGKAALTLPAGRAGGQSGSDRRERRLGRRGEQRGAAAGVSPGRAAQPLAGQRQQDHRHPRCAGKGREEYVVAVAVLAEGEGLTLWAGKRHLTLKHSELDHYRGERGRRGNKLPRGFQRVERMESSV